MMQRLGIEAALLALAALATGCGGSSGAPDSGPATPATVTADGTQQITLRVARGIAFEPRAIAVQAGKPVELTLVNSVPADHDFALSEGVAQPVKIVAKGGETSTGTFTISQPGTYSFICSVPGHAMAGMRGTIVAQ